MRDDANDMLHGSIWDRTGLSTASKLVGRRQGDARGALAERDRAGLLRVSSMLLVGLDGDAVCAQGYWLAAAVQAVPYQVVSSRTPCGSCDGSELILGFRVGGSTSSKESHSISTCRPRTPWTEQACPRSLPPTPPHMDVFLNGLQ